MSADLKSTNTRGLDKSSLIAIVFIGVLSVSLFAILIHDMVVNPDRKDAVPYPRTNAVSDSEARLSLISSNGKITAWMDKLEGLLLLRAPAVTNRYYDLVLVQDTNLMMLLGTITNRGPETNIEFRLSAEIFKTVTNPNFRIVERYIITNLESSLP